MRLRRRRAVSCKRRRSAPATTGSACATTARPDSSRTNTTRAAPSSRQQAAKYPSPPQVSSTTLPRGWTRPTLRRASAIRRHLRRGQHLDAVDLERRCAPFRGHQLDQRARVARHRCESSPVPVIDRAVLAGVEVGKAATARDQASGPSDPRPWSGRDPANTARTARLPARLYAALVHLQRQQGVHRYLYRSPGSYLRGRGAISAILDAAFPQPGTAWRVHGQTQLFTPEKATRAGCEEKARGKAAASPAEERRAG